MQVAPLPSEVDSTYARIARLARLDAQAFELVGRFDHVTRLPNRLQFMDEFSSILAAAAHTPTALVLVTLADARHYNEVLRALGHAFAEDLVRSGAGIVTALLPPETEIYHVSVLSLAFCLPLDGPSAVPPIASIISAAFLSSIDVNHIPIKIQIGVGLVELATMHDGAECLRAALSAAQDSRRSETGVAFYNHNNDAAHLRAFRLLADLPAALLAPDQLSLVFQPRIDMASDRCHGAEALIRWNHPHFGPVSPGEFVPLVEQTALIAPLTDWVMDAAMEATLHLREAGHNLKVSINASPISVGEAGFDVKLLARCASYGLDPTNVELEFTEGTLASNSRRTIDQLGNLRSAGVDVAIDDFGSGYSNFSYLTRIPADVIKIDQSFVRPLLAAGDEDFLLRQLVHIGRGLGFRVCAEGIETAYAYDLLKSIGCQEGQGYHLARPMRLDDFRQWLSA